MSIKCGRCNGRHGSVTEVRACYNGDKPVRIAEELLADERATPAQVKYLTSLLHQAVARMASVVPDQLPKRGEGSISEFIDGMKNYLKEYGKIELPDGVVFDEARMSADGDPAGYGDPDESAQPPPVKLYDMPNGLYATPSLTGNNDLDFWRVKNGRKPGIVFVNRVIGGRQDTQIPRDSKAKIKTEHVARVTQMAALEAITKFGVEKSQEVAGLELKFCRACGIHLTDETSRALGIGPVCRNK